MTGIVLMIIGILIFGGGVGLYRSSSTPKGIKENSKELDKIIEMAIADGVLTSNERNLIKQQSLEEGLDYVAIIKDAEKQMAELSIESETELIDYQKKSGDDFEKFIIQKFNKKFFNVKEWAGDKYVNGIYADTTTQPDILMEFKLKGESTEFWVECKYRSNTGKKSIKFASIAQFERYKNYEKEREIPVFMAIGYAGKPNNPERLFIVPLKYLKNNSAHLDFLSQYEKKTGSDFYFDSKNLSLR